VKAGQRRHRPPEAARPPEPGPVTVIKVNPTVWRHALKLAGGNARRLEVIDATHVRVR